MACGELFPVNIKESGSWVVLWCICWICAANFSSRYVIFPYLWQVSHQPGSILAHVQLCVKIQYFATRASYLHLHCTIVLGVSCTFSDNLGGTGLHKHRGPIPWSMEGYHDLVLSFCSVDYSFSTTKFKFGYLILSKNRNLSHVALIFQEFWD